MSRLTGRKFLVVLAAWLALSLAFGGAPIDAAPPPPRFVTLPNNARVLALWGDSNGRGQSQPSELQQAAASDARLISKTASAAAVAGDGTLHYSIVVTNATPITQTFQVTDTLPAGLSYITNTATDGLVYSSAINSLITTTREMNAFYGDVVTTSGAPPYTEIVTDTHAANICQTYFTNCDDNAITLALPLTYGYFGVNYSTITLDSNGFVMAGSPQPHDLDTDAQNQLLPSPSKPNGVIAPFWTELDLHGKDGDVSGGGDWLYATVHDVGTDADYLVVEWHNAQKEGDAATAYSFQVWVQLQAEHITFAYATPAFIGDTSTATVGFENSDGTLGHSYLYNGAGTLPADGATLRFVALYDTLQLGFDVRAQHDLRGCSSITNTANISGPSGAFDTAAASVLIFGPCVFLPLINR